MKRDHFLTTLEVLEKKAKCLTEQKDRHRMVESEKQTCLSLRVSDTLPKLQGSSIVSEKRNLFLHCLIIRLRDDKCCSILFSPFSKETEFKVDGYYYGLLENLEFTFCKQQIRNGNGIYNLLYRGCSRQLFHEKSLKSMERACVAMEKKNKSSSS